MREVTHVTKDFHCMRERKGRGKRVDDEGAFVLCRGR